MRRFLLWVVVPSAVAAGIVSIPTAAGALLGGWWAVAVGFGASFMAAVFVGFLAWRDAIPIRRLVKLIETTDEGDVKVKDLEAVESLRIPVGRRPWMK